MDAQGALASLTVFELNHGADEIPHWPGTVSGARGRRSSPPGRPDRHTTPDLAHLRPVIVPVIGTWELPDLLDVRCRRGDAVEAQNEVMETWDALRARRNVRKFTAQPVPEEALDRILEAGRRAPSSSNWQPWDFVLVTDRTQLVELAKVCGERRRARRGAAAAISIVAPVPQDDRQSALLQFDLGQATYAMTVAAADLGIGTGHAAAADQEQARAVLGLPEGRFLAFVLSVGYPAYRPLAVIDRLNRRPFDEVVHRGRWGPPSASPADLPHLALAGRSGSRQCSGNRRTTCGYARRPLGKWDICRARAGGLHTAGFSITRIRASGAGWATCSSPGSAMSIDAQGAEGCRCWRRCNA